MKYSLNEYVPHMWEKCVRIEMFPNEEAAAKLVAGYKARDFKLVRCSRFVSPSSGSSVPTPEKMIAAMSSVIVDGSSIIFAGIEAYTAFLHPQQERDFVYGLRNFVEKQVGNVRILVSNRFNLFRLFDNPKYRDSLELIEFYGAPGAFQELNIQIFPQKWSSNVPDIFSVAEAMTNMGEYIPHGTYKVFLPDSEMPTEDYGKVTVINQASAVLSVLYGLKTELSETNAELLLDECQKAGKTPMELLLERFGGETYLSKEKAALRLLKFIDDKCWPLYAWMLKSRISPESYLYQVLIITKAAEHYWPNYVVHAALLHLGDAHAQALAAERAAVLQGTNDPLISRFVAETLENELAIPFLNCGSDFETAGLIRHAAHYELDYGIPKTISQVTPVLAQYLSPGYDYGDPALTNYFSRLRCFRMRNTVDEAFVQRAYSAVVPPSIKKRKDIISSYDDGETALLVVDGMGAEYYPLLLEMAKQNGICIAEHSLVCASLPSSTQFNQILWNAERRLREVKRTDNISHTGYSAYEKCAYEDNLAEIFRVFCRDVMTRILEGLKNYKKVLVTADHGASYLAIIAHKKKMNKTLNWSGTPDDWRYASVSKAIKVPDGMISEYNAEEQKTYYIVKGYNRLPKEGGKEYALHGGATLEEMLVPFVIFTKEPVVKPVEKPVEQLIENDVFDLL